MQNQEKKQITPVEAAAAMMQFTMKSIENNWETIKPVIAAFLTEPTLSEAKEDELLREIYMAALALEIYCIPHAFDTEIAGHVQSGMNEVMTSENLAAHQLSAPINELYLPRFESISEAVPDDLALALVEEASNLLYQRLDLPLKPADPEKGMLGGRLLPFLAQHVGKWPILLAKFTIQKV
ncbi:hypothetical protein ACFQZT_33805 [Paenibacillus sp. GCM10027628]|uniref:hypothetical protein n=1 Tax=Paenibacillus sp. GCM10027628 TaxID=3273413 RepID=UPI00363A1B24